MSKASLRAQPEKLINLTLTESDLNLLLASLDASAGGDQAYLLYGQLSAVRERPINRSMWFINVYAAVTIGLSKRYSCIKSLGFSCILKYKGVHVDPEPFEVLLTTFSAMSRSLSGAQQSIVEYSGAPRFVEHLVQYNCIFDEIMDIGETRGILLTIEREPGMSHSLDLDEGGHE